MNGCPLEVVILNDFASTNGGSTAVALASALGLAARDIPVTLFTCVGPVAPQLNAVPNLEVICLGQTEIARNPDRAQAFREGLSNRRAGRALRRVLEGKSPRNTLVHVHTWTKALSPHALDVVIRLGFRLVVTLHDYFIACPNGGFFVHPASEICRRVPLSLSCWRCNCDRRSYGQKLWRATRTVIQNRWLRLPERASCYIGVSDFSLGIMRPYLPAATPVRVVRNPVAAADDGPAPVGANREFLFVGRFEAEKGVRLFAQAARASGLNATFVGDGPLLPALRQICPQGRFTGWLEPAEIRRHLRRARALVFPPQWYETLGLVVIEAAAAGVPAIVSDRCAATDYIQDGVNGVHFEHGSVESLSRRMMLLSADSAGAARLGQAAYDWYWQDPWTSDRHVDELLDVYADLEAGTAMAAVRRMAVHPGR